MCVSTRVETQPWPEDPAAPPWSEIGCFDVGAQLQHYTATIAPGTAPGDSLLVRLSSDTWIPARDDPQQHDGRQLGILFGSMTPSVVESRATP